MSGAEGDRVAAVRAAVHQLGHHLPGQAPLPLFVHHNTLHGDQADGFEAAIAAARGRTGARGYLPDAAWRAHLASGRIQRGDLEAVLRERDGAALDVLLVAAPRAVTVGDVRHLALAHDLDPAPPERLRWERTHGGLWSSLAPGVSAEARARLLAGRGEGPVLRALWEAVAEEVGVDPDGSHPEETGAVGARAAALLDAGTNAAGLRAHAAAVASSWEEALGRTASHVDVWTAWTGEDVDARVNALLIRRLAAFVDEGVAGWATDGRAQGLWSWFRRVQEHDRGTDLSLPGLRGVIRGCPEDPARAVVASLDALGVPPDRADGVLERTALRTPGWAGMAAWHDANPAYAGQQGRPYALLDLLAVRLVLERAALVEAAGVLGLPPHLDAWRAWMAANPEQAVLRLALHAGALPDTLDAEVRGLASGDRAGWSRLARRWWRWRALPDGGDRAGRVALPLFRLCQHLGMDGAAVRSAGVAGLSEALSAFDQDARGPVWLEAFERRYRETVLTGLAANRGRGRWLTRTERPRAQVVCCIDDREEAFRRHLEARAPDVETLGAAGFFGVAMRYRGLHDAAAVPMCPVVVDPVHLVVEEAEETPPPPTWRARLGSWLGIAPTPAVRTRLVVSAAAEAVGRSPAAPQRGFTDDEQADRVAGLLRAMGLATGQGRLVVLLGHGGSSLNNPHLAAYDCGACSGRHGGPNARAFAAMANRPEVRARLVARGVQVPDDTWFLGAEHDTTLDTCAFFDADLVPPGHRADLEALRADLDHACLGSAHERARKFVSAPPGATPEAALRHVQGRARDPFQARPELGHATHAAGVVGRRWLTDGLFLDRRAFLISYDPTTDADGRLLEGLLLAVGPVGAGINLEYYFSTVDNERFGCGTKVAHNLVGLLGVMAGGRSDLRTGLPRQMIEIHEPMRLLLIVEHRTEVLAAIHARQAPIRELVDLGWLVLVGLDPETGVASRFRPGVGFVREDVADGPAPQAPAAVDLYRGQEGLLPPALVGVSGG